MEEFAGCLMIMVVLTAAFYAGNFFGEYDTKSDCKNGKTIVIKEELFTCIKRELK